MEEQKPWSGLARNQAFPEGKDLKQMLKSENL